MAEQLYWVDPANVAYNLTDPTRYYLEGPLPPVGQYGVPISIVSHAVPLQPGVREQWLQIGANDIRFPLDIFGATPAIIDANRRTLLEAMRPTRGLGILRHIANDGTVRELNCRETSRFRTVSKMSPMYVQVGLVFSAADPFWYDQNYTVLQFSMAAGAPPPFFQVPFLPLNIAPSGYANAFTVSNTGQDVAWPVWTINGPAINPTLINVSSGNTLSATLTLLAGQALIIDTRPLTIRVAREDGSNQWPAIADVSQLWPLVVGSNAIQLAVTGTTSASSLTLQYKQRYEGV